jgi:quercetin dioxygenase-like cupin family protein
MSDQHSQATTAAKSGAESAIVCATCGTPLDKDKSHSLHDYKGLKLQLDGYLRPGETLHRNMLVDVMYASLPKEAEARLQVYNYEIAPGGFTNWHIHMGAQFFVTLQGEFEGHFEKGVLIRGKPGEVYSEPIGQIHRGHNPHPALSLLGIGVALTGPGLDHVVNVAAPPWAPTS